MKSTQQLFLEFDNTDGKFHVTTTEDGHPHENSIGSAYEIPDAIKEARKTSQAPIQFCGYMGGINDLCVPEKPSEAIADAEVFISALAEIAGMQVHKLHDDNLHFIGYTMEKIK